MNVKNGFRLMVVGLALCAGASAMAHEFWMWPQSFIPAAGGKVKLEMFVGEHFKGELTGFGAAHASALKSFTRAGTMDLLPRLPQDEVWANFPLQAGSPGAQVVAYDSQPVLLSLPAEKFHAYLHEEGLGQIIEQRLAAGTAGTAGRERFRRNVKTLLQVDGKSDATFGVVTGQRLELVPLHDPARGSVNQELAVRVLFDGKGLANVLVKAWHRRSGQILTVRAHTDAAGLVRFNLPLRGAWMLSAVQMIPASESVEADWDSYWANLTFLLGAQGSN